MNTLKSTLIALVLLVSTTSFAKTGLMEETKTASIEVAIEKQLGEKVLVGFENFGSQVVKIKITDSEGNTLYSERIKDAKVVLKKFNVSQLPAGDYSYEVSTPDYAVEKTITK